MVFIDSRKTYLANVGIRFLQFVFAVTVIGLYGVDLDNARKAGVGADGRWAFAVVVGVFSAVTALVYMIPFVIRKFSILFAWDVLLFFFWVVLFGIFGKLFINEDPEGNKGIQRMKNAVWIVLINMLLWLVSAVFMGITWWKGRRSTFTGRAVV